MFRPFHLAIASTFLVAVGCAMSSPADLTPDVDPNLPGVDVGNDPKPAPGSTGNADTTPDDAGSKSSSSSSSSSSSGGTNPDSGSNPSIAPDAAPPPAPGTAKPSAGEVLISEIMYDTFGTEPASEWIELYSTASSPRALTGLTLKDGGGRTHVIGAGITIAPGAYVVLARNKAGAIAAKVPAAAIVYEYATGLPDNAGVLLANGATGGLSLLDGTKSLASAPYGGWFSQSGGSSAQLHVLTASASSSKASWCLSLNPWTTGSEKGTPGAADDCP